MWPLRRVLLLGAALRCALLCVGAWQDAHARIRYTDVDYEVFSDAARFMAAGGSPYERATYRYTPLLAAALLPNVWLHPAWGKLLFSAADLGCAALTADVARRAGASADAAAAAAAAALFNPFTAAVSTRGSCDALSVLVLLATLRATLRGNAAAAGALLGAAAHLRVYPVVHALPLGLFFWGAGAGGGRDESPLRALARAAARPARFGASAALSFAALGGACFAAYGWPFLEHAYLYHAGRSDPRHNFSPAFYGAYLRHAAPAALAAAARAQSGAQLAVLAGTGVAFRRDPPAALLLQTLAFVSFNRVITAQYFTWWMALAPLAAPALERSPRLGAAAAAWLAAQLHWLAHAAALEFGDPPPRHGAPFLRVWAASMLFFGANVWLMLELIGAYRPRDLRRPLPKRD